MPGDERPIGVFDSGVGGLSILMEIARQLPGENLLYFADSANCPYGPRSPQEIRQLSRQVTEFLLEKDAKLIVVACNTASAAALNDLREQFPVPFVGMVPAVKPAASTTTSRVVGVLATEATVQGQLFADVVHQFAEGVELIAQVCPGLVGRVEAGLVDDRATEAFLRKRLAPMLAAGVDTIVLGCTHYHFLVPTIRRIAGPEVQTLDPRGAIARQTGRVLSQENLRNRRDGQGWRTYYTSGDPEQFATLLKQLTGEDGEVRVP